MHIDTGGMLEFLTDLLAIPSPTGFAGDAIGLSAPALHYDRTHREALENTARLIAARC